MNLRTILKIIAGIMAVIILCLTGAVTYLSITEYRPKARQKAEYVNKSSQNSPIFDKQLTLYTWNIGYAGLGKDTDFFMDGGKNVNPTSEEVEENLNGIKDFISSHTADAWFLQEVDVNSARTGYVNEFDAITENYNGSSALCYNYKCEFVPIPLPPIGKIESGIATLCNKKISDKTCERIALPCPFKWPVSIANIKRCLLVTRLSLNDSEREVVLVNLHLEAYDDGEGKTAQTKALTEFLQQEYEKGNYVIAGGDFNQSFPKASKKYPIASGVWTPTDLAESALSKGFKYAYDGTTPTCRLLNQPLSNDSQMYVIDGFIVSPNIRVDTVKTENLGFKNSDHNPVKLQITLQ